MVSWNRLRVKFLRRFHEVPILFLIKSAFVLDGVISKLPEVLRLQDAPRADVDAGVTGRAEDRIDGENLPVPGECLLWTGIDALVAEDTGSAADAAVDLPGLSAEVGDVDTPLGNQVFFRMDEGLPG